MSLYGRSPLEESFEGFSQFIMGLAFGLVKPRLDLIFKIQLIIILWSFN